ncbi:uncharacterized protein LOC112048869 [Bicyclus anynana]|uniref:Uncharacterized protein LOC112048869 n=1 Tax=Bicyclus anynana TaxID=110368 RepID=A0A6J1NB99_BICAN|nr:uncharacterized protein LOC112048869 [Bicyclus anynana]
MRYVRLEIIFIAILAVSTVKSECVTYVECLGSFFGSFFSNHKSFVTETQVGNVTVPGFETVKVGDEDLNNLLSGVSDFVKKELDGNINFGPQLNIFQNIGNNTAIFVKSITINNNFGDHNHGSTFKNMSLKETIQERLPTDTLDALSFTTSNPFSSNITSINELLIDKLKNKVKENEILDAVDPLELYDEMDNDDNSTDYLHIDYLEMYKDTTNEYTDIKPTESTTDTYKFNNYITENSSQRLDVITFETFMNNSSITVENTSDCNNTKTDVTGAIFPWIAAIFIKNDTSDQFDYYCDGALLSQSIVITAARCLEYYGSEVVAKNLLVLLGKSSLQSMSGAERAVKVNSVIVHEKFKKGTSENDIALLLVEGVTLNDRIQTACLGTEGGSEAITTGWAISGELTVIPFDIDHSSQCEILNGNNTFCSVYGNEVSVCPSYGGVYAAKQDSGWYLRGIRSGDPSDRGLCFDRTVYYTDLRNHVEWINDILNTG